MCLPFPTTVHRPLGGHCHGRVASHRISLECSGGLETQKKWGYLGFLRFLSWMRLRKKKLPELSCSWHLLTRNVFFQSPLNLTQVGCQTQVHVGLHPIPMANLKYMASSFQTFQLIDSTGYTGCHFIFMDSLQITEDFPSFSQEPHQTRRFPQAPHGVGGPRSAGLGRAFQLVPQRPNLWGERLKRSCHPNPNDICENTSPLEFSVCSGLSGSEVNFLGVLDNQNIIGQRFIC